MGICPLSCSGRRAPVKGRYPPLLLACNALPDGHERLDLCELFLPNAADGQQLPHGFEIAVFRPVINDALRQRRPDTGKLLQLGKRRGVDVDERAVFVFLAGRRGFGRVWVIAGCGVFLMAAF